jgi:hypothetical protein
VDLAELPGSGMSIISQGFEGFANQMSKSCRRDAERRL